MSKNKSNPFDSSQPPKDPQGTYREEAELLIAADTILNALAVRNADSPTIDLHVSAKEEAILRRFDCRLVSDTAALQFAVAWRRNAVLVRRTGVIFLTTQIDEAEDEVNLAHQEEFNCWCRDAADKSYRASDEPSEELQSCERKRIQADRKLADLESQYKILTLAIPERVREHAFRLNRQLDASAFGRAFYDVSDDLRKLLRVIVGLRQGIDSTDKATSGEWWSYLQAKLPQAVLNKPGVGPAIDEEMVDEHLHWLLTQRLGELQTAWNARKADLLREWRPWESVVRTWAVKGTVDVDALTTLLAFEGWTPSTEAPSPADSDELSGGDPSDQVPPK